MILKFKDFLKHLWMRYNPYYDDENIEVVTYVEAFSIFVVFMVILVMLYPKDRLRELVLSETSNYDLTETYLSNMLRLEPNNVDLLIPMARIGLQTKKYDLSQKIIDALRVVPKDHIQAVVNRVQMDLWNAKFELVDDNDTQRQYKQVINAFINEVARKGTFDENDASRWYDDAIMLKQKAAALKFIEPFYRKEHDRFWLEKCLYLATEIQNSSEKNYCVNKLIQIDGNETDQWLKTAYTFSLETDNYEEALKLTRQLIPFDQSYRDEEIRVLLLMGHYKEVSEIYMTRYRQSEEMKVHNIYFIKALSSLQSGNLMNEAVALAKAHEDEFLSNRDISNKIIKLYLAAGKLNEAKRLSLKVLKAKEQQK